MQFSRTPKKFAAGWNLVGTFGWHILQKPHETEGDLQMQSEEKWWTDTKLFALDYMYVIQFDLPKFVNKCTTLILQLLKFEGSSK